MIISKNLCGILQYDFLAALFLPVFLTDRGNADYVHLVFAGIALSLKALGDRRSATDEAASWPDPAGCNLCERLGFQDMVVENALTEHVCWHSWNRKFLTKILIPQ